MTSRYIGLWVRLTLKAAFLVSATMEVLHASGIFFDDARKVPNTAGDAKTWWKKVFHKYPNFIWKGVILENLLASYSD